MVRVHNIVFVIVSLVQDRRVWRGGTGMGEITGSCLHHSGEGLDHHYMHFWNSCIEHELSIIFLESWKNFKSLVWTIHSKDLGLLSLYSVLWGLFLFLSSLFQSLPEALKIVCEVLSPDPEGGPARVPLSQFTSLLSFLAKVDGEISPQQVAKVIEWLENES